MTRGARALLTVAMAMLAGACGEDARELVGYRSDPAPDVDVAELPDLSRDGEPFRFVAPAAGLLVVYFGYTNCPDFCPGTLQVVRRALDDLGQDAERVEVVMVTVDPARDRDTLAGYVQSFVPGGHAVVTADETLLRRQALAFGVEFAVDDRNPDSVKVEHTTSLYAVDDSGRVVLTWPWGTSGKDVAGDIRQLLDEQTG